MSWSSTRMTYSFLLSFALLMLATRHSLFACAPQLLAVDTSRVCQNTTTVDDSHRLVAAQQNLVRTEIDVGTTNLQLGDVRLLEPEGLLDALHVLLRAERGHAVCVMRHITKLRGRLARGERVSPCVLTTSLRMKRCPVHGDCGVLIRTEEEDLRLCVEVHDLLFDSRGLTGNEEVDEASTYFSNKRTCEAPRDGRMVALSPPSGMSFSLRF